jgi:uncharacterized membrane protein YedE/YeeE
METLNPATIAALIGLGTGVMLGLAARLGNFCTLGALETAVWGGDQRRLRLWGVVLAVAIAGTWAGVAAGMIDAGATLYHTVAWNPAASVLGGLAFGYGMALAGNCGFGALVRFGGGDLRSLVVLVVMAIFGFATLAGPLAPLRTILFPQEPAADLQGPAALAGAAMLPLALTIAAGLLVWALAHAPLRRMPGEVAWGVVAGLSVVLSLAGLTWLADETLGAVAVEGPSFTVSTGRTLIWLMTSTAGGLSYSVGSVLGVVAGAVAGALWRGRFRWEACEDPRELGRQVGGAALMGIGGAVAMGCSIGQGVTGMAVLAWSAPVTLAAIVAGGLLGLRGLIGAARAE